MARIFAIFCVGSAIPLLRWKSFLLMMAFALFSTSALYPQSKTQITVSTGNTEDQEKLASFVERYLGLSPIDPGVLSGNISDHGDHKAFGIHIPYPVRSVDGVCIHVKVILQGLDRHIGIEEIEIIDHELFAEQNHKGCLNKTQLTHINPKGNLKPIYFLDILDFVNSLNSVKRDKLCAFLFQKTECSTLSNFLSKEEPIWLKKIDILHEANFAFDINLLAMELVKHDQSQWLLVCLGFQNLEISEIRVLSLKAPFNASNVGEWQLHYGPFVQNSRFCSKS